MSFWNRF